MRRIPAAFALVVAMLLGLGCQERDDALLHELRQLRKEMPRLTQPDPAAVQAIFSPLTEALQQLQTRMDGDRQRQAQLAAEVRMLAGQQRSAQADPEALNAMQARIAELEKSWQASMTQAEADKQLVIRALEASSSRLEALLQAVQQQEKPAPTEAAGKSSSAAPGQEGGAKPRPGKDPEEGEEATKKGLIETLLEPQVWIIFLAVAFFLSVALLLLFPNRLRKPVPQVTFEASPETEPVEVPEVEQEIHTVTPASPAPRRPDARTSASPVRHSLALRVQSRQDLDGLIEILDSYLKTEPYILTEPAPQVSLEEDELRLSFFALPTLSQSEHALLDATVRRLRPKRRQERAEGSPAA